MRKIRKSINTDHYYYKYIEIHHLSDLANKRHGLCKWIANNGNTNHVEYFNGQQHGIDIEWDAQGNIVWKKYFLYDEEVSKEEYKKYKLIEKLSGLGKENI